MTGGFVALQDYLCDILSAVPGNPQKVVYKGKRRTYTSVDWEIYADLKRNAATYGFSDVIQGDPEEVWPNIVQEIRKALKKQTKADEGWVEPDPRSINPADPGHPHYIYLYYHACNVIGAEDGRRGWRFYDSYRNISVPKITHYNVDVALRQAFPKDQVAAWWSDRTIPNVYEVYRPRSDKILIKEGNGEEKRLLNCYIKPAWRDIKVHPRIPKRIAAFLTHLFPDIHVRRYVLSWVYHSLTTRCQTYLFLNGGQGTGKNLFVDLLRALHGRSNFATLRYANAHFNDRLKHATLVFYDELRKGRDPGTKETLKANINGEIEVEGKFRDAEQVELHASFVIASNSLEALTLEPIDRRFSVPEITQKSLLSVFEQEWIDDLIADIQDDMTIAEFGNWLLQVFEPSYTEVDAWQKERFEEIVIATARNGFRFTLDRILAREFSFYSYDEEKEDYELHAKKRDRSFYPVRSDWLLYFQNLKIGGKPVLQSFDEDKFIITPIPEFQPQN